MRGLAARLGGQRVFCALAAALAVDGPTLIDVEVEPAGYAQQLKAMRG